jgi:hydrogenase large subunit
MSRKVLGPFNRVEGDLEVQLDIEQGLVKAAYVNSSLFRGFERILIGKAPTDALVYTPRICGICSVAQSVAAATALANAQGLTPAPNGELSNQLILACENVADHLSHFYLFFMPDFARPVYENEAWYEVIATRFKAQIGSATSEVLKARAEWLHITGLLAGKWPHSLSIQAGGSTRAVTAHETMRLMLMIRQFRQFLERVVFADKLEQVSALSTLDELKAWSESHPQGDFARFLQLAEVLDLYHLGRSYDQFLSVGAYSIQGAYTFKAGTYKQNTHIPLKPEQITEDISHSWMQSRLRVATPWEGETDPHYGKVGAYSWCKAPRLDGQIMETGALARQLVEGQPLIVNAVKHTGGNVATRVMARVLELARLIPLMEQWCNALNSKEPFCTTQSPIPDEAQGVGLIEAARGSLGHWVKIQKGKIAHYQIIAPTTWNFSPRDELGQAGALEKALEGTDVTDEGAIKVQHIVRSFDPCMVCTVH